MPAFATLAAPNLGVEEQFRLITDVQNVPVETVTDADGNTRKVYGSTAASEAAMTQLYAAFRRAINYAASTSSRSHDRDEAEAVATEAFVKAVRDFDLTSASGFHHTISAILVRAVKHADRTSDVVPIPSTPMDRYRRLLREHDGDAAAAYEAAENTRGDGLSKAGFLAIHRVVSGVKDVDALDVPELADDNGPDAEHLLTFVSPRQETALRLRFGFDDDATEQLREDHGYPFGAQLGDADVVPILNARFPELAAVSRQKVQRERTAALATMRDAWTKEINAD